VTSAAGRLPQIGASVKAMRAPAAPYVFSTAEYGRRRRAVETALDAAGVDHLLVHGANRAGPLVAYLTGWAVTREAHVLLSPGRTPVMWVSFFNHVPTAQRLSVDTDVRYAGEDPMAAVLDELGRRPGKVGVAGPLPPQQYVALSSARPTAIVDGHLGRLRLIKSDEELEALSRGAALTDLAARAVLSSVVGASENELAARCETAYVSRGGGHHIHYFAVTPMLDPSRCVPSQVASDRRVEPGDLLSFEISASSAPDYSGQLLRTVTVAADPTPLVVDLHAAADAAVDAIVPLLRPGVVPQQLIDAARVIEDAGFTTCDDLVHGFGGGYLPPVIGSPSRQIAAVPTMELAAGMTVVVQPNVVTQDKSLGVQTGELMVVTADGGRSLHDMPRGLGRVE
jgi:Xaa-Pro dipeptidase